jgi:excisionase family DNA binding protein
MGELWDVARLSEYLSVKKSTVYALVEQKQIPHYRLGRLARFRPQEIEEWLQSKKVEPEPTRRTTPRRRNHGGNVSRIVRQAIDEVRSPGYTAKGKSDRIIEGLGKEG